MPLVEYVRTSGAPEGSNSRPEATYEVFWCTLEVGRERERKAQKARKIAKNVPLHTRERSKKSKSPMKV